MEWVWDGQAGMCGAQQGHAYVCGGHSRGARACVRVCVCGGAWEECCDAMDVSLVEASTMLLIPH